MSDVLAIDCGQSGSRARRVPGDPMATGAAVSEAEYGPVFTQRPLEPQLAELICRAVEDLPQSVTDLTVAVGSSGWSDDGDPDEVVARIDQATSPRVAQVILAHDSVTSYLGALGTQHGVPLGAVVASGTGVVTLGVGDHRVARVDGWGYLFGDAGSGFWIGRAAIEAVLRAYDGRGPQTTLTGPVSAEFPDLSTLYLQVQADPQKVSRVARYARITAEHADSDPVAADICREAGRVLAESVTAALRVVGLGPRTTPAVARVGKVFGSAIICGSFDEHLRHAVPEVRIAQHPGTALAGAALLADLPTTSALYPAVQHRSGRN